MHEQYQSEVSTLAEVLSEIDAELASLEQLREKSAPSSRA